MVAIAGVEKPQVLVDVVQRPANEQVFPGLYALSLPERPFWGPKRVLVNTQWGNRSEIVAVDISTGDVEPLSDQERWPNSSWTLLNTMPMTGAGINLHLSNVYWLPLLPSKLQGCAAAELSLPVRIHCGSDWSPKQCQSPFSRGAF